MISDETKDHIYRVASLGDLLPERIPLRRYGKDLRGPCCFHNGKHDNLCYYAATDTAFCHQCKEHVKGPVDFLMKADGLSYPEALRALANRYHIEVIEVHPSAEAEAEAARKKSYQEAYGVVSSWYQQQLFAGDAAGDAVLEYLHKRGFTDETIRSFQLGFSPRDSRVLGKHLLDEGYTEELLLDSHLLLKDKHGMLWDKYHGRLIFSLHDHYGHCIGYSGRNLVKGSDAAKYINSRESMLFQKRHTLYGYAMARAAIVKAQHCYLVEGFTDAMMMHQCGISHVVASQGTTVTPEQARMIRKLCTRVTLLLDGDAAGHTAVERVLSPLLEAGCICEVVTLPDGEDPASYGLKYGAASLQSVVGQRVDFVQWLWDRVEDKSSVTQRATCVKQVTGLIAKVQDTVYRKEYEKQAVEVMGVDIETASDKQSASSHQGYRKRKKASQWRAIRPLRMELGKLTRDVSDKK